MHTSVMYVTIYTDGHWPLNNSVVIVGCTVNKALEIFLSIPDIISYGKNVIMTMANQTVFRRNMSPLLILTSVENMIHITEFVIHTCFYEYNHFITWLIYNKQ